MTEDLSVVARQANNGDIEPLADVRRSHIASIADDRGAPLLTEQDVAAHGSDDVQRLQQAMTGRDHHLVVGTLDDHPFGYGILRLERLSDQRTLGVVDELLVDREARQVGLGEAIMIALVEQASRHGCFGVDSRALPGDRETKNFFESFGLKARLLTVHRSLE